MKASIWKAVFALFIKNLSKAWGQTISDFADIQFPKPIERTRAKNGLEQSIYQLSLCLLRVTTGCCGIWWFDMFGGFFADDKLLEVMSKTAGLMESQTHNYLKPECSSFKRNSSIKRCAFV